MVFEQYALKVWHLATGSVRAWCWIAAFCCFAAMPAYAGTTNPPLVAKAVAAAPAGSAPAAGPPSNAPPPPGQPTVSEGPPLPLASSSVSNAPPPQGSAVNVATSPVKAAAPNSTQAFAGQIQWVLGFGFICLAFQFVLLWRADAGPDAILRNVAVTLVVTLGIVIVMTGFGQDQLAPIIGLLGTIIGFLLGQQVRAAEPSQTRGGGGQP